MALLMSVAKQTVLGTGRAITRHDCWNKMSASRAVLCLKVDGSAVGKDIIHINTGSWWGVRFDVLGHPCFFTQGFCVQHIPLKQVQIYWERDRPGHRYPSSFFISLYLLDSSIFMKNGAVMQNIRDHQCSVCTGVCEKTWKILFPIQCLIKW